MAGKKRDSSFEILTEIEELKLPAGALQLAERLDVPSASIGRELSALEKAGLLTKVQNKGRILTPKGKEFLEEEKARREKMKAAKELIEASSEETGSRLEDILLVRRLLEGYSAEACANHIRLDELKRLEELQEDYRYALRHGKSGGEEDLLFHLEIARLSGSPTIFRMLKLILTDHDAYASFNQAAVSTEEITENEHEHLLGAIRSGDGKAARAEMEAHLMRVEENLTQSKKSPSSKL